MNEEDSRAREYTAQAVTLAQYIAATKIIPNVIKIDAEGAELSILKGLEPAFDNCRPILTLEVGDTNITDEMPRSRAVVDWVLAHGYRLTEFLDGKFVPASSFGCVSLYEPCVFSSIDP